MRCKEIVYLLGILSNTEIKFIILNIKFLLVITLCVEL